MLSLSASAAALCFSSCRVSSVRAAPGDILCLAWRRLLVFFFLLRLDRGARGIAMSVSVCVCVCVCLSVCPRSYLRNYTSDLHPNFYACYSVLLWRHSDMLRISAFVDDIIFAHKLIGCSTSPPGWGSEAHTYAALSLARRNTRCRQRTLGTTFCSLAVGVLNIYDIMLAHNIPVLIATRKWRVLKVTLQVAKPGTESAVYDCLVFNCALFFSFVRVL